MSRLERVIYLVGEVRAEAGVAAEPLVCAIFAAFDDVSCDYAASVLQRSFPAELHRALVLVLPGQVQRWTGGFCETNIRVDQVKQAVC